MTWLVNNWSTVLQALWSHLALAIPAIALRFRAFASGGMVGLPLPVVAFRARHRQLADLRDPFAPVVDRVAALIGTTVRSPVNVVIALTGYGMALMVRSTADALDSVNRDTVISATALGYSGIRRLIAVELPLAGPGLLAGLRVVSVSTMALVTVSAVLGIPSLGTLFTDGFQRGIVAEIVTGIVSTAALAVLVDRALVAIGWLLLPWTRART